MPITWSDQYATGVPQVDHQHQTLFDAVNKLEQQIADGTGIAELPETMAFLKSYVQNHFTYEEMCMSRGQCAATEANKEAHKKFWEGVLSFEKRLQQEGPSEQLLVDLYNVSSKWLVGHICKIDVHLRACAAKLTNAA